MKLKNYYRHRFQRSRSRTYLLLYQLFGQIFSSHFTLHQNNKWFTFLSTLHPQTTKFWKVARYFTKSSSQIPPLLHQGTQVYQSAQKAEVLAQIFERTHYLAQNTGSPRHTTIVSRFVTRFFLNAIPHTPPLQLTNAYEVKRKIRLLKTRSTPGLDDITPTMLRHLSRKALTHLTTLSNHLLLKGHFPETWKRGKVIPILKPNKPSTNPTSYRPISLLSTLGKLFERIVADRLISFTNQHNPMSNLVSAENILQFPSWHV
jgi:hypothetical protein